MEPVNTNRAGTRGGKLIARLFAVVCLLGMAATAQGQAVDCSEFPNATIDGFVNPDPPSNINIDTTCRVLNFPASNPLTTNFAFFTSPGQNDERWLVVFDNVVHTGQMACNAVAGHKIWFTNGSSTTIQEGCQNYLIPVEKIDKRNPPGTTTAAIGVPFTYTLTIPVLFDPAIDPNTGDATGVIDWQGSVNDLHSIILTDDLNATGVDLTYLSHTMYWRDSGTPVSHTFTNNGGQLRYVLDPIIPATEQIVIELTVVLEDTPLNAPGTQFVNTAKWSFGRLIDGEFFEPLPGEWGITQPLTIAAPELVMTKTGPATLNRTLNLGEWGEFGLDVQNIGLSDAWDITIRDLLPNGPTGGMCNVTPEILSAQVFAADGTTPVPGKGPLTEGVDYALDYSGAPGCELTLTLLTDQGVIAAGERLIISYQTQLDSDSQDGALLTNIAGVTRWFNGDASNVDRIAFNRTLTDGTPGTLDHEDEHTVEVGLFGWFFEKTVENLTTGDYPATIASPGDVLRYSLRLQTTDGALSNFQFLDDLGALNSSATFEPGTLTLVAGTVPAGANTSGTDPFGGSNGDGLVDVGSLDLPASSEVTIQYDVTIASNVIDGTVITNQAGLYGPAWLADSDDPFVNGQADPTVQGDEDPTRVLIEAEPPQPLTKANTQSTATIGEEFSYLVTVPSVAHTADIYDVRIIDDLTASAADLQFVDATFVSGNGNLVNSGSDTNLVIEGNGNGIDIPAGEQAVIEITVRLLDTSTNVAGLAFTNTAAYTYNLVNNDAGTQRLGDPGTTQPMTIVEPDLTLEKTGPLRTRQGVPATFTLNVHNAGDSLAWNVTIDDLLPNLADGGMCDAAPQNITAQVFEADGVTPVSGPLVEGTDFTATFAGDPVCTMTLSMLTSATGIGVDQRLIVNYDAELDAGSLENTALTNVAGATEWFGLDVSDAALQPYARTYTRVITDGTVGILDHEDAHTTAVFTPTLIFEKYPVNVTTGDNPAATATPGDTIRYVLYVENAGDTLIDNFSIVDELDNLNGLPAFQAGTLNVVSARCSRSESQRPRGQPPGRVRSRSRARHCQRYDCAQPVHGDVLRFCYRQSDRTADPVRTLFRCRQGIQLPDRGPECPAGGRDAALHDYGAEHWNR
jgi:fimbrial isopeptide formation D2 family protein/uncharacterized repeat protein (TIGR01451 family)